MAEEPEAGEPREMRVELLRELSRQLSLEEGDPVTMELDFLQNVYLEELEVKEGTSGGKDLVFHITPSTGDQLQEKYLSLDLHISLPKEYPEAPAVVRTGRCRGISDARLKELTATLACKAGSLCGGPMVFELVELAKESLTDHNLPCEDCVVCLQPFKERESVTRTECYHYFHMTCLQRYLHFTQHHQQQQLLDQASGPAPSLATPIEDSCTLECPVCREPITPDAPCLRAVSEATPTQSQDEETVVISDAIRQWQREMARLLRKQRDKGGLIDLSAKDQVIDETWVMPVRSPHDASQGSEAHWNVTGPERDIMAQGPSYSLRAPVTSFQHPPAGHATARSCHQEGAVRSRGEMSGMGSTGSDLRGSTWTGRGRRLLRKAIKVERDFGKMAGRERGRECPDIRKRDI